MTYKRKKGPNKKLLIAIALVVIIAVAVAAFVYTSGKPSSSQSANSSLVGVKVGDWFTYSMLGTSTGPVPSNLVSDFGMYNATQSYTVKVVAINGTTITIDANWVFNNGTSLASSEIIDLQTGDLTNNTANFWGIYPTDLNTGNYIYPHVYSETTVNGTDTQTYPSGARTTDYYSVSTLLSDSNDPTGSTECSAYDQIYFDRATGFLTSLENINDYNNPVVTTIITWTLVSTNAWQF